MEVFCVPPLLATRALIILRLKKARIPHCFLFPSKLEVGLGYDQIQEEIDCQRVK